MGLGPPVRVPVPSPPAAEAGDAGASPAGGASPAPPPRAPGEPPPPLASPDWVAPSYPAVRPASEDLSAIDSISVDDILANPLSQVREVPKALHVAWAHVMADVLEQIQASADGGAEARDRSLKWFLVVH